MGGLAGIKVHARETGEHADWRVGGLGLRKVEFNDLIAGRGAGILHIAFNGDWIASLNI